MTTCTQQLRSLALQQDWHDRPAADVELLGFKLVRRHSQMPARALTNLNTLADERLPAAIKAMFSGAVVNPSEQQPALHMALRAADPASAGYLPNGQAQAVLDCRTRLLCWAEHLQHGQTPVGQQITNIVHIGIGGSDLSPRLLMQALHSRHPDTPKIHFLAAPASGWRQLCQQLDPHTTQVIVVSKSLSTVETLHNWELVRAWQQQAVPELVITAAVDKAAQYGIDDDHVLPLWRWVGGRYSFSSAVSLSAAAALGKQQFLQLLAGAEAMDNHFQSAPVAENLPVQLALQDYWNHAIRRFPARGVFSYEQSLDLLGDWLQQLEMESNGKSVSAGGRPLEVASAPLVFGGSGPKSQHSLLQMLHQGERSWPLEFLGVLPAADNATALLVFAQLLGQLQTFVQGADHDDAGKRIPGKRPVTALLMQQFDAHTLGMLLACYEHKAFSLGTLIGCNPFDQWGVEAGKKTSAQIFTALSNHQPDLLDADIASIVDWLGM